MELFRKFWVGGEWKVYLVNPEDASDQYSVGRMKLFSESEADNFVARLNRIASARILTDPIQISECNPTRVVRLED